MPEESTYQWWAARRGRYNQGLIVAGVLAFLAYGTILELFGSRLEPDTEITIFQAGAGVVMIGIANIFYFLGPMCEVVTEPANIEQFRQRLFALGFWFSCGFPFLVPFLTLIRALFFPWH